jgi:hypothetical protein
LGRDGVNVMLHSIKKSRQAAKISSEASFHKALLNVELVLRYLIPRRSIVLLQRCTRYIKCHFHVRPPKFLYQLHYTITPPYLSGCPGIEVFNWRKGFEEWETSWIRHGDPDQPSLEDATDSFDVTIFHPTELLTYHDSRTGAERDTTLAAQSESNSCRSCKEYLESSFEFLSFWWETLYLNSNGYFGYQDEVDEDSAVVSVSMCCLLLVVRYC